MSHKSITLVIENNIAHIQLNRPDEFNTMDVDFWQNFPNIIEEISNESTARVIVISSTGKHFCAGMDLAVFTQANQNEDIELGRKNEKLRRTVLKLQACFNALEKVRMPVLMAIHPQTKSIMKLLKMGKSNRDIIGRLNCSPKTITKCRNYLKQDLIIV